MKKLKLLILLFTIQISLTNCQNKTVDTETYEVTPEFAKSIGKPEVHFTVEIPKHLEFDKPASGKEARSYGMVQKLNAENKVIEMCSFGYIKVTGTDFETSAKTFLKQVNDMLKGAGYEMEESKIGFINFDGKDHLALTAIATMKEGLFEEFVGRYYFNTILKPNADSDLQIMFLMSARDDQNIKSYNDFEDKLDISTIWQTFKYH